MGRAWHALASSAADGLDNRGGNGTESAQRPS